MAIIVATSRGFSVRESPDLISPRREEKKKEG